MKFVFLTSQEVKHDNSLIDFIFDTYVENMYYLFGDDLKSQKSKESWIYYNLENPDVNFYWRLVVARNANEIAGFLIYTIKKESFIVNDIQIIKKFRFNPFILRGLFYNAFVQEQNKFEIIEGYINDKNAESKMNFLRYAERIEKTERGVHLYLPKDRIFKRFRIF